LEIIYFQGSTAPIAGDIKVDFIPDESLSKTGLRSIAAHS
jgi:hypothetical protein